MFNSSSALVGVTIAVPPGISSTGEFDAFHFMQRRFRLGVRMLRVFEQMAGLRVKHARFFAWWSKKFLAHYQSIRDNAPFWWVHNIEALEGFQDVRLTMLRDLMGWADSADVGCVVCVVFSATSDEGDISELEEKIASHKSGILRLQAEVARKKVRLPPRT